MISKYVLPLVVQQIKIAGEKRKFCFHESSNLKQIGLIFQHIKHLLLAFHIIQPCLTGEAWA
jgi:hypothetical protein